MLAEQPILHLVDLGDRCDAEIRASLSAEGLRVLSCTLAPGAAVPSVADHPDLAVLCLSGEYGGRLACCRDYRLAYPESAILLVHEGLSEWEESIALELGADAVIRRPDDVRRLLAQIRALLRRQGHGQTPRLQLLAGSRTVRTGSRTINLTAAEFDVLSVLAAQPGTVVSRDTISLQIRGRPHEFSDRTIDLCVARLRRKLGDDAHDPRFIRTVQGEGYLLMVAPV